ncbi:MAG: S8 family peptidase [Flavobacteriales bacterium]|nr:S8 family peptidase [Flavobacteriales bacterium]
MLLRPTLFVYLVCTFAYVANAQQKTKIDFQLDAFLNLSHNAGEQVDLYIHGDVAGICDAVKAVDGTIKMARPSLVAARVPVQYVRELALSNAIKRFEFSMEPGQVLNDSMRVKNHVSEVHMGLDPLLQGYDGEDVIIGIIDSGMDYRHPDFQDAGGNTRILYYWDQTFASASNTPQPYNYGQEWNSAAIDAGSMTAIDQPQFNGHGSTVTGTAAGNGLANGRHKGCAPEADIIVVSADFTGNFRAHVADGVKYIFDLAESLGKPAVVNASLGSYMGSHDGKDASALFIDDLLEAQPGRVMVCAAGNSGAFTPYHVENNVGADTSFTWFGQNQGVVAFEVWGDIADLENVEYAIGADRKPNFLYRGRTPFHLVSENVGVILTDTLRSLAGNKLGVVNTLVNPRGGQYQLQVQMFVDSLTYNYRFMTTGSGKFDIWSSAQFGFCNMVTTIPTVAVYPPIANYVMPDDNKHMVDSWACSDKVLTVANYNNELTYTGYDGTVVSWSTIEGALSLNSSKGPTRDDRIKPDVAATGDITMSSGTLDGLAALIASDPSKVDPGGMHFRNGGTSMASPVVTGAAALYLQKCPTATWQEVGQAIRNNTRVDGFTGTAPNNSWGYGKLDAFAALVNHVNLIAPTEFCDGTTIEVEVPGDYATYTWSNGGAGDPLLYGGAGPLSVEMISPSGCTADSDTLTFTILPSPDEPTISQTGATLTSSVGPNYQWYLNGVPIQGATDQIYDVTENGDYRVGVTAANGCSNVSLPVYVSWSNVEEHTPNGLNVWPSPVVDVLNLRINAMRSGPFAISIVDVQGKIVYEQSNNSGPIMAIPVEQLAGGTYSVNVLQGDQRWSHRFVKLP